MKEIEKMARDMEKENILLRMEINMKAIGRMI